MHTNPIVTSVFNQTMGQDEGQPNILLSPLPPGNDSVDYHFSFDNTLFTKDDKSLVNNINNVSTEGNKAEPQQKVTCRHHGK